MKIDTVTFQNFRCFGPQPTTIQLADTVTAMVGANGSGKTALLEGLTRVFGLTKAQRDIKRSDFHVSPGTSKEDRSPKSLYIELRLVFPELSDDKYLQSGSAVPDSFQHMIVEQPGHAPVCRVRLEAEWVDDGTLDGNIDQRVFWVTTTDDAPTDEAKVPLQPHDRGLIQVHYVPAARDAATLLTYATGSMAGRLLRAALWSEQSRKEIQGATKKIGETLSKEDAVQKINAAVQKRWGELYDAAIDANPTLSFLSAKFEEIIQYAKVVFHPSEEGGEHELSELSDGQKSLFYFSLAAAVFDIEQNIASIAPSATIADHQDQEGVTAVPAISAGFDRDILNIPSLTVFAVEEPENHLAPFYLSRIIGIVKSMVSHQSAQAVFTSHSPAILGRIEPGNVRHFRLDTKSRTAIIRAIHLPKDSEETAKYIREAVIAYPELYFARFVILSEGDSEQVVLPRLGSALGLEIDKAFVSVVPLGGRHINHFWRLLSELEIPFATLLDLDLGREGGGWGRIKYACEQLIERDATSRNTLLTETDASGNTNMLTDMEFQELHKRDSNDTNSLQAWLRKLEELHVFYSCPLDLDLMMLELFGDEYKSTAHPGYGPRIPKREKVSYEAAIVEASKSVLGEGGDLDLYSTTQFEPLRHWFPWYRYLFIGRSKPSTHIHALSLIGDIKLKQTSPDVLQRLLKHAAARVRSLK